MTVDLPGLAIAGDRGNHLVALGLLFNHCILLAVSGKTAARDADAHHCRKSHADGHVERGAVVTDDA